MVIDQLKDTATWGDIKRKKGIPWSTKKLRRYFDWLHPNEKGGLYIPRINVYYNGYGESQKEES